MMRFLLKWVVIPVALVGLLFIGYYGFNLMQFVKAISSPVPAQTSSQSHFQRSNDSNGNKKTETGSTSPAASPDFHHAVNILLMGGDSRGASLNGIQRSDSMIVLSLDPTTKKAVLMSVLRDTYTQIPGYGMNRINAAFAFGGPQLAVKTVSNFLDIPIQYYAFTDFEGFIKAIDALGGIEINVPKDMNWTDSADGHRFDIHLQKGEQHLNGKTALEFVRFRHDQCSDFCRTQRQREFLQALAKKLASTTSLLKFPQLLKSVAPDIHTNMDWKSMLRVVYLAYQCKSHEIITKQIPPQNMIQEKTVQIDNISSDVLTTNLSQVQAYVNQILQTPKKR